MCSLSLGFNMETPATKHLPSLAHHDWTDLPTGRCSFTYSKPLWFPVSCDLLLLLSADRLLFAQWTSVCPLSKMYHLRFHEKKKTAKTTVEKKCSQRCHKVCYSWQVFQFLVHHLLGTTYYTSSAALTILRPESLISSNENTPWEGSKINVLAW